ncbi:hypothetical protein HKCCE2091_09820 [Rhodobacterales bacterium HKCCE2091]|nr:hypothetical protein [Rhodobacterales bacterium HKCCE2091]
MTGLLRSATLAAALGLAGPAAADHFTSIDLGGVNDQESCIARAQAAFDAYAATYGQAASTSRGTWTISGWDLPPLSADVTVLCVEVGGVWNAFATGHAPGEGPPADQMVEQIRDFFVSPPTGGGGSGFK